ncbi:uncharacterized protein ACIB01_018931 [Guaruba guarouba]
MGCWGRGFPYKALRAWPQENGTGKGAGLPIYGSEGVAPGELGRGKDPKISPDLDPDLGADAQPPMKSLIQDCWVDVGELWDRVSAVASRLPPLRLRMLQLQQEIHQHFEGDPQAQEAARLMVEAARLSGARAALTKQAQELRGSLMDSPESALEPLRRQLQEGKQRLSRRWIQLQALAESNGKLLAQLRPLQAQARGAVRLPPELQGEGRRLLEVLCMLGKERAPLPPPR